MLEARLVQGRVFKQIIESIKDLVVDLNMDCSEEELSIQSMDASHVSLVSVSLSANAFDHYRCDRPQSLGFNSGNMAKILKLAGNDDIITIKSNDQGDAMSFVFESPSQDRIADFELRLMDIDNEQLGIPDTPYKCTVSMPSMEFQRIIRDLQVLGDTCTISCTKEGIRFSVTGELGTGNILTRAHSGTGGGGKPKKKRKSSSAGSKKSKKGDDDDDDGEDAVMEDSAATSKGDDDEVLIEMEEPVELNFALRYLNFFTKATSLSSRVIISMSPEVPIVIEYPIEESGHVKYYLAPKIEEEQG